MGKHAYNKRRDESLEKKQSSKISQAKIWKFKNIVNEIKIFIKHLNRNLNIVKQRIIHLKVDQQKCYEQEHRETTTEN